MSIEEDRQGVPEGYRDLVEEYFRSLAREPDPSGSQR